MKNVFNIALVSVGMGRFGATDSARLFWHDRFGANHFGAKIALKMQIKKMQNTKFATKM